MERGALSSVADETPEGKSIVELATQRGVTPHKDQNMYFIPFTAETRSSGVNLTDGRKIRKGAQDAIWKLVTGAGNLFPDIIT